MGYWSQQEWSNYGCFAQVNDEFSIIFSVHLLFDDIQKLKISFDLFDKTGQKLKIG